MKHKHYYELQAKNTYGLGLLRGEASGAIARGTLEKKKQNKFWQIKIDLSKEYYERTDHRKNDS